MLWVDSDLSDWELVDDELTELRAAGITGKGASTKTHKARDDVHIDPMDVPEQLQPLMEWISEYITTREREELAEAIYEYRDVFSSGPEDMGETDFVNHTIDTGEHRPIRLPPRRLPITKQDVEKAEVQKMLDQGVIEPCQSSWASPVVLVTKKDDSTRFCVDYRKVNEVTRKDAYPLPQINDTFDALRCSQYFSTLD